METNTLFILLFCLGFLLAITSIVLNTFAFINRHKLTPGTEEQPAVELEDGTGIYLSAPGTISFSRNKQENLRISNKEISVNSLATPQQQQNLHLQISGENVVSVSKDALTVPNATDATTPGIKFRNGASIYNTQNSLTLSPNITKTTSIDNNGLLTSTGISTNTLTTAGIKLQQSLISYTQNEEPVSLAYSTLDGLVELATLTCKTTRIGNKIFFSVRQTDFVTMPEQRVPFLNIIPQDVHDEIKEQAGTYDLIVNDAGTIRSYKAAYHVEGTADISLYYSDIPIYIFVGTGNNGSIPAGVSFKISLNIAQ